MSDPYVKISEASLRVMIGGTSFLDLPEGFRGRFTTREQAQAYLDAYGFDLEDPIEAAELQGHIQEAIGFIRKHFLKPDNPEGIHAEIPKKILETQDVRDLMMMAAQNQSGSEQLRLWACSILRVVHAITHMDRDVRWHYFSEIQKQIFDRFYRHLHRDEAGLYLGDAPNDPLKVLLKEFQVKPKKTRESTLMKLLHKPESVAEEVFDRVGIRFVTQRKMDVLRVVHFLESQDIVVAANIKPSRSRNTLIDVVAFESWREQAVRGATMARDSFDEIEKRYPQESGINQNPYSSQFYRAIQFTARQLIKIRNPLLDQIRDLKGSLKQEALSEKGQASVDRIDLKSVPRTIRFFYPYEIQLMDEESYLENERGRSAHKEYKNAQRTSAMKRVMGKLAEPKGD